MNFDVHGFNNAEHSNHTANSIVSTTSKHKHPIPKALRRPIGVGYENPSTGSNDNLLKYRYPRQYILLVCSINPVSDRL